MHGQAASRWAVLEVIDSYYHLEAIPLADELLSRLSQDPFSFIRAEVVYRRAEYDRRMRNRGLSQQQGNVERAQLRVEAARVKALRPRMTFEDLETAFWSAHRQPDYTTGDVLAFLESYV